MENNQFQNNNTNPDFNIPTDEATKNPIKKVKRWARKNPKKFNIIMGSALAATTLTAILAPTLVAVTRKSGGDTPTPTGSYTITFDLQGGTIEGMEGTTMNVLSGTTYGQLPKPTLLGKTFSHWTVNGQTVELTATITSSVTVTANWTDTPTPAEQVQIVLSSGEFGTFEDGSSSLTLNVNKGSTFASANIPPIVVKSEYENQKVFTGWVDLDGNPIDTTAPIESALAAKANYDARNNNVVVSFVCSSANGERLQGQSTFALLINKTWGDIPAASRPQAVRDGYTFGGWTLTKGGYIQIDSSYVFSHDTHLYPIWNEVTTNATFNYELTATQSIVFGSSTMVVDLKANSKQWQYIARPVIEDSTGKIFSSWQYKNGNTWEDLTNTHNFAAGSTYNIRPVFVDPNSTIEIEFINGKDGTETDLTWVGSTKMVIEADSVSWTSVSKPGVYKAASGTWDPSFGSEYYFDNWYYAGTDTAVEGEITHDIKVYPKFLSKTPIIFKFEIGGIEQTFNTSGAPNQSWDEISKPEYALEETGKYFMGWKGDLSTSNTIRQIRSNDYIQNFIKDASGNLNIQPYFETIENCHTLKFVDTGVVQTGVDPTTGAPVYTDVPSSTSNWKYVGNSTIGILRNQETYLDEICKPQITFKNKTDTRYSFVKWQIKNGDDWQDLGPRIIPSGQAATTYEIRPVLEQQIKITYAPNQGTLKDTNQNIIYMAPSATFGSVYKPDLNPPTSDPTKVFKNWYYMDGANKVVVDSSTVFTKDTTLLDEWSDTAQYAMVNFKLTETDIAEGATLTGTKVAVAKNAQGKYLFGDATRGYATKPYSLFEGWYLDESFDPSKKVDDNYELPTGGADGTTVYAHFVSDTGYRKVCIVEGDYEILSDQTQYMQTGSYVKQLLISNIKKVGKKVTSWQWKPLEGAGDWADLDDAKQIEQDIQLKPILSDATETVKFWSGGNDEVVMTGCPQQVQIPYYAKVAEYINEETYKATCGTDEFLGWQIYDAGDNSFTPIDENTEITKTITVVPKFKGKSDFKYSNMAYYYDTSIGKWAGITKYTGSEFEIVYGDETTGTKSKADFNYEILFGLNMTSIPDDFMTGCVDWDNGGKPLVIPAKITKIGSGFLSGCTSFDQNVDFSNVISTKIEIGQYFMSNCYTFNQNMDLSKFATVRIIEGSFMSECQSFCKELKIGGKSFVMHLGRKTKDADIYTLSSSNPYCALVTKGVTYTVGDINIESRNVSPFRKIVQQ